MAFINLFRIGDLRLIKEEVFKVGGSKILISDFLKDGDNHWYEIMFEDGQIRYATYEGLLKYSEPL